MVEKCTSFGDFSYSDSCALLCRIQCKAFAIRIARMHTQQAPLNHCRTTLLEICN